jgi:hypothetical protein
MLKLQLTLQEPKNLKDMTLKLLSIGQAYQAANVLTPSYPAATAHYYPTPVRAPETWHLQQPLQQQPQLPSGSQVQQQNTNNTVTLQSVIEALKSQQQPVRVEKQADPGLNTSLMSQITDKMDKLSLQCQMLNSRTQGNGFGNGNRPRSNWNRNNFSPNKQYARIHLIEATQVPSSDGPTAYYIPSSTRQNPNNSNQGQSNYYPQNDNRQSNYPSNDNRQNNNGNDNGFVARGRYFSRGRSNFNNRGNRSNRGRGQSFTAFPGQQRDSSGQFICFTCGTPGHMSRECPRNSGGNSQSKN